MCDAYFYNPRDNQSAKLLSQFASKNKQSTAELIKDFFKVKLLFSFLFIYVHSNIFSVFENIIFDATT